jgi:hypothetical protein
MGRNEQKLENMALVRDPFVFLLQVGNGMVREWTFPVSVGYKTALIGPNEKVQRKEIILFLNLHTLTLKMGTVCPSETLVSAHETTVNDNLNSTCSENLKNYVILYDY